MAKSSVKSKPPAKKSPAKDSSTPKPDENRSDIVDIAAEDGEPVEPPPPEVVEPDPEWTEEEAAQARKDYLLTRFWISARGFWGSNGDRLAWMFTIGLLILIVANVGFQYGINVWNRAIFDAIEKKDSAPSSISRRCSSRSRSAACCLGSRRCSRGWAFSAAGGPG